MTSSCAIRMLPFCRYVPGVTIHNFNVYSHINIEDKEQECFQQWPQFEMEINLLMHGSDVNSKCKHMFLAVHTAHQNDCFRSGRAVLEQPEPLQKAITADDVTKVKSVLLKTCTLYRVYLFSARSLRFKVERVCTRYDSRVVRSDELGINTSLRSR